MTLIEGIGDEVTHFFIVLFLLTISVIAWWSTNITERLLVRTVLIVEGRSSRRTVAEPPTQTTPVSEENNTNEVTAGDIVDSAGEDKHEDVVAATSEEPTSVDPVTPSPTPVDEVPQTVDNVNSEEVTINVGEDSSSELRNRRIAFFNNKQTANTTPVSTPNSDVQAQNKQLKAIIDNQEEPQLDEPPEEGHIRIRLKYLNDDQKLVEGKLQEQLGDFKKRHFSLELAGRKFVRLIFNGQVLQEDTTTLQNYGLFDNCVVHCLVHQQRNNTQAGQQQTQQQQRGGGNNQGGVANGQRNEDVREWDLGNLFLASVSLLLGLAWYGRYQYAQWYSATSTVALVTLTGIFTVSLIGMYLPDTDGLREH